MRKLLASIVILYTAFAGLYVFMQAPVETRKLNASREFEETGEEEGKTDQPSKFLLFHGGIRTREGNSGPGYQAGQKWLELQKAKQTALMRRAAGRKKSNGVIKWTERGPANVPGRTRAVLNIPGDPANNTWLAGAATGGIWRTADGGKTWSDRSVDFMALPVSALAADNAASAIYAGTGEFISSFYSAIGNGIYKSLDKGLSWQPLPATHNHPDFSIVTGMIVHPDNPDLIVASTVPHDQSKDKTSAIMRSSNGGATWLKVAEVNGYFEQVIFTPGNFNVQYASQKGVGVWKSSDAGITWTLSNNGMVPSGRIAIAVSPNLPGHVFASAEGNVSGKGADLYYSTNAGASWSLVDVRFENNVLDFLEGQGFYDNTILCDPFNSNRVYVGGVSLFRVTVFSSQTSKVDYYSLDEPGTEELLVFQSFSGVPFENGQLDARPEANATNVEIRFGPGKSQRAHRFTVPPNKTNGTGTFDYSYQNYPIVPFEVWDVTNNRQLMVSFRDQNRNGKFDLLPEYLTNNGVNYLLNSREYVFIHNEDYAISPSALIAATGGQSQKLMYNFFPALAENATWDENNLPDISFTISYHSISRRNSSTEVVADGRGSFGGKNGANQVDLTLGVHADHHCMTAIIENKNIKTYKLLLGNDGGVFVSNISTNPGMNDGEWTFSGYGLNTTQFYGADKEPGGTRYVGGTQDNGTRISPKKQDAGPGTSYTFAVDGDGFETLWHSKDPSQLLATRYNGHIHKSSNNGASWNSVAVGDASEFPFVTKIANSKDFPDRVFTVGSKGVYVSHDFGDTWNLTPIASSFVKGSPLFLDVEVSRADPRIVWAGSGMNNTAPLRKLFVSNDGGSSFQETVNYTSVKLGNITRLATHPIEPHTAYALFSFANSPKILRTTDLGKKWEDISGFGTGLVSANGFPDVAVYCLYVHPDKPHVIWAGTEIGIVESVDNGVSWTLLDDFPPVAVWDMKGQDNEVVIASHGRGIWTATLDHLQHNPDHLEITAAGTTPSGLFAVRIKNTQLCDSVQIFLNSSHLTTLPDPGLATVDLTFAGIPPGAKKLKLISWTNHVPRQSMVFAAEQLDLSNERDFFSTYFRSDDELSLKGMFISPLPGSDSPIRYALQSDHPYVSDEEYSVTCKVPIRVSATLPFTYFSDIAIVEPTQDKVLLEATTNGLDWITLSGYDATHTADWLLAFNEASTGTNTMYREQSVDLGTSFNAGDLILVRMRLLSDKSVTGWGWAIDYLSIQESPTGIEIPQVVVNSVYPNPASNFLQIEYNLARRENVHIELLDVFGKRIFFKDLGYARAGNNKTRIDINGTAKGSYLLVLNAQGEKVVNKVIVKH